MKGSVSVNVLTRQSDVQPSEKTYVLSRRFTSHPGSNLGMNPLAYHGSDLDLMRPQQMRDSTHVSVKNGIVKRITFIQRNVGGIVLFIHSLISSRPGMARRTTRRPMRRSMFAMPGGRDVWRGGGRRGRGRDGILTGSRCLMMTASAGWYLEERRIRRRLDGIRICMSMN